MARFSAIPDIPVSAAAEWQSQVLEAMKQNVELLAGIRGESDRASKAVLQGAVKIKSLPEPTYNKAYQMTVQGKGYSVSGVDVAGFKDYVKLINDVGSLSADIQRLANDVNNLRDGLQILINQLRG